MREKDVCFIEMALRITMHPCAQAWCQTSNTVSWSQSPVPAPSSKEGGERWVSCPWEQENKLILLWISAMPKLFLGPEQWMGGWGSSTATKMPMGAGLQHHCCLISQSSVYVSVILLMTALCQLQEEKWSPALQKGRAAWADTTWSLTKPASTKITSQKHSNTSEQAEWANIGSALCITGLQHLWSSLQSPKFGFAWICCILQTSVWAHLLSVLPTPCSITCQIL